MCSRIECYVDAFQQLQPVADSQTWCESTHGRSPLQPLLLLSVLDHISMGRIQRNFISPSEELEKTFQEYLTLLSGKKSGVSVVPSFVQLGRYPFWELRPRPNRECDSHTVISSLQTLRDYYFGAKFADELYPLLLMDVFRKKLALVLVETYFSPHIEKILRKNFPGDIYDKYSQKENIT